MYILAGDIGGTSTRLQIVACDAGVCRPLREQRFASAEFSHLSAVLHEFLHDIPPKGIQAACFGIAGPVQQTASGQFVKVTKRQENGKDWRQSETNLINKRPRQGHK